MKCRSFAELWLCSAPHTSSSSSSPSSSTSRGMELQPRSPPSIFLRDWSCPNSCLDDVGNSRIWLPLPAAPPATAAEGIQGKSREIEGNRGKSRETEGNHSEIPLELEVVTLTPRAEGAPPELSSPGKPRGGLELGWWGLVLRDVGFGQIGNCQPGAPRVGSEVPAWQEFRHLGKDSFGMGEPSLCPALPAALPCPGPPPAWIGTHILPVGELKEHPGAHGFSRTGDSGPLSRCSTTQVLPRYSWSRV